MIDLKIYIFFYKILFIHNKFNETAFVERRRKSAILKCHKMTPTLGAFSAHFCLSFNQKEK